MTRHQLRVSAFVLALAGCAPAARVEPPARPAAPPPVTDARGVVTAMHARYAGRFFTTLRFKQNTTTTSASGRETKGVWNEYLVLPGRLRIDYQPLSTRSGVLYTGGRVHSFIDGKAQPVQRGYNLALTLIGDVYAQPVDSTLAHLDSSGVRLGVMREDTWQGARVWVVGAAAGDTTSAQFWVDRDSLLIRRLVTRDPRAPRAVSTEMRFLDYRDVGGYPVAFDVHFLRDGRRYFREQYFDVQVNTLIPADVFDPARWATAQIRW